MKLDNRYYKLPFSDDGGIGYIYENNNNFAFMVLPNLSEQQINKILKSINSETYLPLKYREPITLTYYAPLGVINLNDKPFIVIRGWGRLTSPNCENLEPEKAKEIQDNFAEWLISKLQ